MTLYQAWTDMKKEGLWVIVYTVAMAVVLVMLLLEIDTFYLTWRENYHLYQFEKDNIFCVMPYDVRMKTVDENQNIDEPEEKTFIPDALKNEKVGSYCIFPNSYDLGVDEKYSYIVIFTGCYAERMGLVGSNKVYAYVSEQYAQDVGKNLYINGEKIPVMDTLSEKFDVYHPIVYIGHDDSSLKDTLVLCCKDIEIAKSLFPPFMDVEAELLENLILLNPTSEECDDFEKELYEHYGAYYCTYPVHDYIAESTVGAMKYSVFKLCYYFVTVVFLAVLLVGNVTRMIDRKVREYTIHYLYGADLGMLQRRAGGFIILLHIIPCMAVIYQLIKNYYYYKEYASYMIRPFQAAVFLMILIIFLIALYVYAYLYVGKIMKKAEGLNNLRREN